MEVSGQNPRPGVEERSAGRPNRWLGGWVGTRAGLDDMEES
jgi:hypothetical protein